MRIPRSLRDVSVALKVFGIMGLLALTAGVAGWSGIHFIGVYNDKIGAMQRASERAVTGEQINGLINAVVMDSRGIYMAKDRGEIEKFGDPLLENLRRIGQLTSHWSALVEPGARGGFDEGVQQLQDFIALRRALVDAARVQGAEAANKIGNNDANRANRERVNKTIVMLAKRNADDVAGLAEEMAQFKQRISTLLPMITLGGISVVAILACFLVIGGITRPLLRITSAMRQLANGDLNVKVENLDQADEIGLIARALEVFRTQAADNQRLTAAQVEQRREGEEQKRLALTRMAETIEATSSVAMAEIDHRSKALATTADEMRARAKRTGVSARGAATASGSASANAATVASAAEQLEASIREISMQVENGTLTIARAITAGAEARSIIDALNERVSLIGVVADMISDIAAKTNLLALNATIEAARAGVAGKGFAVVASEVKQLATQTAGSTKEIARHIADVRTATASAVDAVARIETTINDISETSGAIAAAVVEQGAATAEIARNVVETACSVQSITERSEEVSTEAEFGGQQAEAVLESTRGLTVAVQELKTAIIRTVRGSSEEVNRRVFPRSALELPCRIESSDGILREARVVDLSQGGARIETSKSFAVGSRGKLHVSHLRTSVGFVVLAATEQEIRVSFASDSDGVAEIQRFLEQQQIHQAA